MAAPSLLLLSLLFFLSICDGRIHKISLKNDVRKMFVLSTFGFRRGGSLAVNVTSLTWSTTDKSTFDITKENLSFGFTLDKSSSPGISSYMEKNTDYCPLKYVDKDDTISVIWFNFDPKNGQVKIMKRGDDVQNISIISDSSLGSVPKTDPCKIKLDSTQKKVVPLHYNKTDFISTQFVVHICNKIEEGLYNLYFHNCANFFREKLHLNLKIQITEKNVNSFLSAGRQPLPAMYASLCLLVFFIGCFWWTILRKSESSDVYKIHYLMLVLIYLKSLAFLFHAVNYYFIGKEGIHEAAWAVLYYITHLLKGALLFVVIVLIGAGWAFIKHILSDREKKLFLIVIPLQILSQVAQILMDETEEAQVQHNWWRQIFILVDLICCGAILFPIIWSIRHLQAASQVDGKVAVNLQKLKLFRHFYIMVVCYIYFTRIIVSLLRITTPFRYEWLQELFREIATLIFFVIIGYKFRPSLDNPYLQVPVDSDTEEEIEIEEVLTKSSALDTVVRVNKTPQLDSVPKQKENSHIYD